MYQYLAMDVRFSDDGNWNGDHWCILMCFSAMGQDNVGVGGGDSTGRSAITSDENVADSHSLAESGISWESTYSFYGKISWIKLLE